MSKRFTDTEKWKRPWFRSLPIEYRLFWLYICDNCDISGIWYVDVSLASFLIGAEIEIEKAKMHLAKQISEIENGQRWLIKDFIPFQYGKLTLNNNLHRSIMATLSLRGMAGAYMGLVSPTPGAKVKDKVLDKDKVKVKDVWATEEKFLQLWERYPNKDGRKDALRHFMATTHTAQDWLDIQNALDHYLKSDRVKNGFVKNGSTWFNNWKDWVNYKEVPRADTNGPGHHQGVVADPGKYDHLIHK